jgi:hypothetical protein
MASLEALGVKELRTEENGDAGESDVGGQYEEEEGEGAPPPPPLHLRPLGADHLFKLFFFSLFLSGFTDRFTP